MTVNPMASKGYALKRGMFWILRCVLLCMTGMQRRRMLRGCGGILLERDSELGCTQAFRQLDTGDNLT